MGLFLIVTEGKNVDGTYRWVCGLLGRKSRVISFGGSYFLNDQCLVCLGKELTHSKCSINMYEVMS